MMNIRQSNCLLICVVSWLATFDSLRHVAADHFNSLDSMSEKYCEPADARPELVSRLKSANACSKPMEPNTGLRSNTTSNSLGGYSSLVRMTVVKLITEQRKRVSAEYYDCSAVLIHRDLILTSAHCLNGELANIRFHGFPQDTPYYPCTMKGFKITFPKAITESDLGLIKVNVTSEHLEANRLRPACLSLYKNPDNGVEPKSSCAVDVLAFPRVRGSGKRNNTKNGTTTLLVQQGCGRSHAGFMSPGSACFKQKPYPAGLTSYRTVCKGDGGSPVYCNMCDQDGKMGARVTGILSYTVGKKPLCFTPASDMNPQRTIVVTDFAKMGPAFPDFINYCTSYFKAVDLWKPDLYRREQQISAIDYATD